MALLFPLTLSAFQDHLNIIEVTWMLRRSIVMSGQAGGDINTFEKGPPKWTAQVTMAATSLFDAEEAQALIEAVEPHERFYMYNPKHPYPRNDPTGSIIGSSVVKINSILDPMTIRLNGLPFNYVLSIGDMFCINSGGQVSLHRIVEQAVAAVTGISSAFEVRPAIPVGITANTVVDLTKPYARMMIIPGSFDPGSSQLVTASGMSFGAIEAP